MKIIINNLLLLFVKQEDFLQAEKYIDLFLVLDNAFVSMNMCALGQLGQLLSFLTK